MLKSIIFLTILTLLSSAGFSQQNLNTLPRSSTDFNDYTDYILYEETYEQCRGIHSTIGSILNKNTFNATLISVGQSLAYSIPFSSESEENKLNYVKQGFISVYTLDRINSFGYALAIQDCFPNRYDLQKKFTISMMVADNIGKIPAVFANLALFQIGGKAFSWLKASYTKIYYFLIGAGALTFATYTVLEIRKKYLAEQLTDQERIRLAQLESGLEQITSSSKSEIFDMAADTEQKLIQKINSTTDPQLKHELVSVLNNLRLAKSALN